MAISPSSWYLMNSACIVRNARNKNNEKKIKI
jgi:hypothetical protein